MASDFETTTHEEEASRVWSATLTEINKEGFNCKPFDTEDEITGERRVMLFSNIDDYIHKLDNFQDIDDRKVYDITIYFHNLAFDGKFIIDYLLRHGYKYDDTYNHYIYKKETKDKPTQYKVKKIFENVISDMGAFYSINIVTPYGTTVKFLDSTKLLPFSLDKAAKSFGTKTQKTEMDFENSMENLFMATPQEKEYIKKDAIVLAELMEILFKFGLDKMTIGSCCISEYSNLLKDAGDEYLWKNLILAKHEKVEIDQEEYEADNLDTYCRQAYRGGMCYVNFPHKKHGNDIILDDTPMELNETINEEGHKVAGIQYDVNSLYPSVMHGDSNNYYPVGQGELIKVNKSFKDNEEVEKYIKETYKDDLFIIRLKLNFDIKEGHLPTIQIKNDIHYKSTSYLLSSKPMNAAGTKYYGDMKEFVFKELKKHSEIEGYIGKYRPTITVTSVDLDMILKQYNISNIDILDLCIFKKKRLGLFDIYINKWMKVKEEATINKEKAKRQISKLMMNNLYGKLGSKPEGQERIPYINEKTNTVAYLSQPTTRRAYNVAIAAFITAYARKFTQTAAQANFDRLMYIDTDSLHLRATEEQGTRAEGVPIHSTKLLHWSIENKFNYARFIRQKTYIEGVIYNGKWLDKVDYDMKACGCPERCKLLFLSCVENKQLLKDEHMSEEMTEYYNKYKGKLTIRDFNKGMEAIPGKLRPKTVTGGVKLLNTGFKIC